MTILLVKKTAVDGFRQVTAWRLQKSKSGTDYRPRSGWWKQATGDSGAIHRDERKKLENGDASLLPRLCRSG